MKNNKNFVVKCKKIKIMATDVDGVLTDGGRYFSQNGEIMKKFHARDGMGVNILLRNKIKTVIVTKENSKIVKKWAKEMNIVKVYNNAIKKEEILKKIQKDFNVTASEVAYIGDDVNDIELLKKVGVSATPNDVSQNIKKNTIFLCKKDGGEGAFREFSDVILSNKFLNKTKWY